MIEKGKPGFVYACYQTDIPGWVKIGVTQNTPLERLAVLSHGAPSAYLLAGCVLVEAPYQKESSIHRALQTLHVERKKEFYKITPESACTILEATRCCTDEADMTGTVATHLVEPVVGKDMHPPPNITQHKQTAKPTAKTITDDGKCRLFNIQRTAEYIGLAPGTIRNRVSAGTLPIPYVKLGSRLAFDKRDLDDWIDRLPRHDSFHLKNGW